jgi:hypothetical protein
MLTFIFLVEQFVLSGGGGRSTVDPSTVSRPLSALHRMSDDEGATEKWKSAIEVTSKKHKSHVLLYCSVAITNFITTNARS